MVTNFTAVHCLVMYHHVHRRHEHCDHVISTTTATTLGLSNNNKFQHRHHNHSHKTSTKIPQPKASATITNANDDDANNIIQLKLLDAQNVEMQLSNAVYKLNRIRQRQQIIPLEQKIEFPSVRQCNAGKCVQCIVCCMCLAQYFFASYLMFHTNRFIALATFGDAGEFRRALTLFMQMKKSVSLLRLTNASTYAGMSSMETSGSAPKPTLVTYSTLMSRAVSLGKPKVALRLWNLMQNQPNFYTNVRRGERMFVPKMNDADVDPSQLERNADDITIEDNNDNEEVVLPDVIFCNTLMNAYAKLGDFASARSVLNAMLGMTNIHGVICHDGIPKTEPTVVTYNTLADACKVAGELGAGLEVLDLMTTHAQAKGDNSLLPDARTYTILISAVARKKKNENEVRDVRSGGEKDPDMAFELLNRMISKGITPNGMTFCALIDVCSRCQRTDLALNGLQIMLRQKSKTKLSSRTLFNEVGAWTSAINACGKSGRTDTAIRLFRTMQKFGVKPNSVTCGCLADCLLKATPIRISETLEVLQYMKKEKLVPGAAMYTSLMGIAMTLAEGENKSVIRKDGLQVQIIDKSDRKRSQYALESKSDISPEAIVLYTELMRCLIHDGNDNMLLNVFLVFQEMRNAGATPDVACYNTLLRACTLSGDIEKAQDVLQRMATDGVEPTRNTWRGTLKAARKAKRSDIADLIWDIAVRHQSKDKDYIPFVPTLSDVELLMTVYVNELGSTNDHEVRSVLNRKIIKLYEGIVSMSDERGLHHVSSSLDEVESNEAFMFAVLRASVSIELHGTSDVERTHAKNLACDVAGLETFQTRFGSSVDRASKKALQIAQGWLYSY